MSALEEAKRIAQQNKEEAQRREEEEKRLASIEEENKRLFLASMAKALDEFDGYKNIRVKKLDGWREQWVIKKDGKPIVNVECYNGEWESPYHEGSKMVRGYMAKIEVVSPKSENCIEHTTECHYHHFIENTLGTVMAKFI